MPRYLLVLVPLGLLFVFLSYVSANCNEAVCASLVSKCMLLKSCECDMSNKKNCTCCKDCHRCLAKLYAECCSCVGLCASSNPKQNVDKMSSVEHLTDPIPDLFDVLTEEEDTLLRWRSFVYPAYYDLFYFRPDHSELDLSLVTIKGGKEGHKIRHGHHLLEMHSNYNNCTVAYMSQCMSLNKCKVSCKSMGAARFRWFHQYGCCECIGSTCLAYGKNDALCLKCPPPEGEEADVDDYDYPSRPGKKKDDHVKDKLAKEKKGNKGKGKDKGKDHGKDKDKNIKDRNKDLKSKIKEEKKKDRDVRDKVTDAKVKVFYNKEKSVKEKEIS